ncbi:hypothetical protein ACFL4G_08365 [Thermodesulfobacteriota bacterium]
MIQLHTRSWPGWLGRPGLVAASVGLIFVLASTMPASSADWKVERETTAHSFQGSVMKIDLDDNLLVVGERNIDLSEGIEVYDRKGNALSLDELEKFDWVYVLARLTKGRIWYPKVYILPGFVRPGERDKYPYMKEETVLHEDRHFDDWR